MEIKNFITFSLVFLLSLLSCKAQNKDAIDIDIRDCVNKIVNKPIIEIYEKNSIDFYDTMMEIEDQLVKLKLINDTSKASYLELFSKIENKEKETYASLYNKTIIVVR